MFRPVRVQVAHHKEAIRDAYTEGYHAAMCKDNPYSVLTQSGRHHAFSAGRYDKTRGFAYEPLEV